MGNKPFAKSSPVIVNKNTETQGSSIFPDALRPFLALASFLLERHLAERLPQTLEEGGRGKAMARVKLVAQQSARRTR